MLYLAYGSNLHPARLTERVPSASLVRTVSVQGYRLAFHKRGGDASAKCNMFRTGALRDRVHGVVYRIDPAEKPLLDACEGPGYGDPAIEVGCLDGPLACFTYLARPEYIDDGVLPFDWYKALVVAGARHHGLPDAYVDEILRVPSRDDPDPARRRLHDELLARMEAGLRPRGG